MKGLLAAVAAAALVVGLGPFARGADDKDKNKADQPPGSQTVYGTIAGVTTEGEMVVDYQTKRAVEAEATCLTVVGSPRKWSAHEESSNKQADTGKDAAHAGHSHRDNVYFVWITPKTKVCEIEHHDGKDGAKKECSLDHLEVGDKVEIQFRAQEPSGSRTSAGTNHTDSMRRRHGRHRIQTGDATAITIVAAPHSEHEPSSK